MKPVLLDTGPVVALLDAGDEWHGFVRSSFARLPAGCSLVTSAAVVTEVMFHLEGCHNGPRRAAAFLEDARVRVEPVCTWPHLHEAAVLMEKYKDVPMDFADATLVLLACQFGGGDIATLDERGFCTYRFLKNKSFRLLLQEAPTDGPRKR